MTFDDDFLQTNFQAQIREISKLKQDLVERENECMFWYREYEDTKEVQSTGSAKIRKRLHIRLKIEAKRHE